MADDSFNGTSVGKHAGAIIELAGMGHVQLAGLIKKTRETAIYHTSLPGIAVKVFDLECGVEDEVSYGPYLSYTLELENFQDIAQNEDLRSRVPVFFGADINSQSKYAFIVMEYLEGMDLQSWCDEAAQRGYRPEWVGEFREAVHETLGHLERFHRHGIILTDFKPDNVIRLSNGRIKFVDLGAFFTPRHSTHVDQYVYSATPDYAELVIDTSNVQSLQPLTEASDIFSAGVALFELSTGSSRLAIDGAAADDILSKRDIYLFRDSQIRDVWHSFPHLESQLPLLETQLRQRRLLFSELWHLLKGFLAHEQADWESLDDAEQHRRLFESGISFIVQQLPEPLAWLANPIAQATILRRLRCRSVRELRALIAEPLAPVVLEDLDRFNGLVQYLRDLEQGDGFLESLNHWEVRQDPRTGHWAVATHAARAAIAENAPFTCLRRTDRDDAGHRYYRIVADLEADDHEGRKLTLEDLKDDQYAWILSPDE